MTKSNKHQEDRERYYATPFGSLPSVTTVLALLDKSAPLMNWVASQTASYYEDVLDSIIKETLLVSEIDKEYIISEGKKCWKKVSETAMDTGSKVHNLIEQHLGGQDVTLTLAENPELELPYKAFLDWMSANNFKFVASEREVCTNRFAGTLDAIAVRDEMYYVIDFKTSNAIYEDYLWQIAAYREAAEHGMYFDTGDSQWHQSSYDIEGAGILRLDKKTGIPQWKEYSLEEVADGLQCFNCLLELWHLKQKIKEWTKKR